MCKNNTLFSASQNKKDEFYTQLSDIEAEMRYYCQQFQGKTIYCNCDNPEWSNFWKYFYENFDKLGLKKLVATFYDEKNISYKRVFDGIVDKYFQLNENGDFRSKECIEILKEADMIITNPPFSLFREFVAQLIKYNKKFIIMGNVNALTYKEIFPLIKENRVWLGYSIRSGDREFRVPDNYPLQAAGCRIDDNGQKYIRVKGVRWFTNVDYEERYYNLENSFDYECSLYPKFDNSEIISVSKTKEIPQNFYGLMGVPITFLDKYNPKQFEIIGNSSEYAPDVTIDGKIKKRPQRFYLNGKRMYDRIVIRRKVGVAI